MAKTRSIGRLYVTTTTQAQGSPLIDRGITIEHRDLGAMKYVGGRFVTEERRSGKGIVIRAPFTRHRPSKAIVIGWWDLPANTWMLVDPSGAKVQEIALAAPARIMRGDVVREADPVLTAFEQRNRAYWGRNNAGNYPRGVQ